jgi:amidophosphoribosyltransferase
MHLSGLDSYAILKTLSQSLDTLEGSKISVASIIKALREVYLRCRGSFACTVLIDGHVLVGFPDLFGIKPLALGKRQSGVISPDWMLASESAAFKQLDFSYVYDVYPGKYKSLDEYSQSLLIRV